MNESTAACHPLVPRAPAGRTDDWPLRTSDFGLPSGFGLRFSDFPSHGFSRWKSQGTYSLILAATLILLPITVRLGGTSAAYVLSGLAFWGVVALGVLVVGNVSLGLLGVFRLLSWLTSARLQP